MHNLPPLPVCSPSATFAVVDEKYPSNVQCDEDGVLLAKRSLKVLVLTNDSPFCALVRSYLEYAGFCVFTCSAADRAEQLFIKRCDIDLWLIDVHALGVEAVYVASRVRELKPWIPVLVLEGTRPDEDVLAAFLSPGYIRLRKPVDLPALLAAVHRLLTSGAGWMRNARSMAQAALLIERGPDRDSNPCGHDWVN